MVCEDVADCLWHRSSCNHMLCLLEEVNTLQLHSSFISDNSVMASTSETDYFRLASPVRPEWVFSPIVCLRTVTDPIAEMLCFSLNTGWGQNPKNKWMQLWYIIVRIPYGCSICLVCQLWLACNWSSSLIYTGVANQEGNKLYSLHFMELGGSLPHSQ